MLRLIRQASLGGMVMRRMWVAALAALGLSGCAPTLVSGNEVGGIVGHVSNINRAQGFAVADAHCKAQGKAARITNQDWVYNTMTFDCVQADAAKP